MIDVNEVFKISKNEILNRDLVEKITKANYSNVLIYKNDEKNIVSMFKTKWLLKTVNKL